MAVQPNFVSSVNNVAKALNYSALVSGGGIDPGETLNQGQIPVHATVFTAGNNGSWLRALNVKARSTRDLRIRVDLVDANASASTGMAILGYADLPASAEDVGVVYEKPNSSINLMDPAIIPGMDFAPNRGLRLKAGQMIKIMLMEPKYSYSYEPASGYSAPLSYNLAADGSKGTVSMRFLKNRNQCVYGVEFITSDDNPAYFALADQNGNFIYTKDGRFVFDYAAFTSTAPGLRNSLQGRSGTGGSGGLRHITGFLSADPVLSGNWPTDAAYRNQLTLTSDGTLSSGSTSLGQLQFYMMGTPYPQVFLLPGEFIHTAALGGDF